jgi:PIN domain nuclease of toxin-antitoxin system
LNLLLDTHALAWWLLKDARLPQKIFDRVADPECAVWISSVSALEMATKFRIGKWTSIGVLLHEFEMAIRAERFSSLPVNAAHALRGGLLVGVHRDPFDRLLAAQSLVEGFPLVTNDQVFKEFGVDVIW